MVTRQVEPNTAAGASKSQLASPEVDRAEVGEVRYTQVLVSMHVKHVFAVMWGVVCRIRMWR
jgi:hypothetical protein